MNTEEVPGSNPTGAPKNGREDEVREKFIAVAFKGIPLYCPEKALEDGGEGPLAPPDHIDTTTMGLNLLTAFKSDTFANIYRDGSVKRYGVIIGHREDIQRGNPKT
jgi:hypothetical protein